MRFGASGADEPDWLAGVEYPSFAVPLHFPPGVPAAPEQSIIRVLGHFDDPIAKTCRIGDITGPDSTPAPIGTALSIDYCRHRFVVESFKVLGSATFPPS